MSTQEAVRHVEGEVRELIRRSGLDPAHDSKAVRRLVQDAVQDYDERSLHGGLPTLGDRDSPFTRSSPSSPASVRSSSTSTTPPSRRSGSTSPAGLRRPRRDRRADHHDPHGRRGARPRRADAQSSRPARRPQQPVRRRDAPRRLAAARRHPRHQRAHWPVNIRKFVVKADHLDDLVRLGTLPRQAATFLEAAVASGLNVLVAGGTQAGKTTLLNCLRRRDPGRASASSPARRSSS